MWRAAVAASLLTACTTVTPDATGTASPDPQRPQATAPATTAPSAVAGTATPLAAAVVLDGPPESLAGIDGAATVIERSLPAGGTGAVVVTRHAPAAVGPLRAASAADATLATMWRADLVTTRATTAAVTARRDPGLAVVEEGTASGAVLRDPARLAPHNAYAVAHTARSAATRAVATPATDRATPWTVAPPPVAGGSAIDQVAVDVPGARTVTWSWDARSGTWRRAVDGDRQLAAGGAPIAAGTVIVAETDAGHPRDLHGAGAAVVLRAGRRYAARWHGAGASTAPQVDQRDGSPFPVGGTVWLHLCEVPCARRITAPARRPYGAPR
jgi:hypothetical protein